MSDSKTTAKAVAGGQKTGDGRGYQPYVKIDGSIRNLPGRFPSEIEARRVAEAYCRKEGLL